MRLNPAATKASSNLKDVRSSTVQPKTFPPNASGATSSPELPKLRLLIFLGGRDVRIARVFLHKKRRRTCIWMHFCEWALRQKLLYPERGTSKYLVRLMLRLNDVRYRGR